MKFLDKKQIEKIIKELKEDYGIKELKLDYAFYINNEDKVYLISKDIKNLDTKDLRINGLGLYFLNMSKGLRLSIEGSQIIGKKATKNVHEVNETEIKEWLKGYDLDCKDLKGYQIIKYKNDFYGMGHAKDNKIKNFVPKYRRIKNV